MSIARRFAGASPQQRAIPHSTVGLYRAGETDVSQYIAFVYTEATFSGKSSIIFDAGSKPLQPGTYELRLLHDESYVVLASTRVQLVR